MADGKSSPEDAQAVESVGDFTRRIKVLLERNIRPDWVRGELSNLRQQSSGHCYFSLKDSEAQLSCVLFRGDALRQNLALRDGMQVVAFGEISVYEARGNYQLVVRVLVEDGLGRLQQEYEKLKQKLAAEGLFHADKKRALPFMPSTIGFITSPTGAAVQDFIRILSRRGWRGRLIILPARVQGAGAALEMIEVLEAAQRLEIFELLVIGRGGGSLEDLWEFNHEDLVRAIARSIIPIISAVGHEIDFTLADFAADLRAETPSAAAELISSQYIDAMDRAKRADKALQSLTEAYFNSAKQALENQRGRLRLLSPSNQIEKGFLRLDDLTGRLRASLVQSIQVKRGEVVALSNRLERASPERRVESESQKLLGLWKRLQSASPTSVLNRGFAIMRGADGKPILRKAEVRRSEKMTAEFADGIVRLQAEE